MTRHACGYCGCEIDKDWCACPRKPALLELAEDYADWYADKGADHPATKEVHQKLVDKIKAQEETLLLFKQGYQLYVEVSLELRKKDDDLLRQALAALQLIDDAIPFPVAKQTIAAIKERLK